MRRSVLLSLTTALAMTALAACGSDDEGSAGSSGSLDQVVVTDGEQPEVTVSGTLTVDEQVTETVTKGDGPKAETYAHVEYLLYSAADGKVVDSSFTTEASLVFPLDAAQTNEVFIEAVEGVPVGSRVVTAFPATELGASAAQLGFGEDDAAIMVFDVTGTPDADAPAAATGTEVPPAAGVPPLTFDGSNPSGFDGTAAGVPPTLAEGSSVVIEGAGDVVEPGDGLLAEYVGQVFPNGAVFDTSWTRDEPIAFQIGTQNVIACWDNQLVGKKVGSRVILTCPAEVAYGDADRGDIKPGDTLTFAVDLLDTF